MKLIITESQIKSILNILKEDKTMDMGGFELKMDPFSQRYDVEINSLNNQVITYKSEFKPISKEEIQKLVDKLIRLEMITLFGYSTDVSINIWEIDEDSGLYIETYHYTDNDDDMSDFDGTMKYSDFLNL